MEVLVSNVNDACANFSTFSATHAVSFRDDDFQFPDLGPLKIPEANWLRFNMKDQYFEPGTTSWMKCEGIVDDLIGFAQQLPKSARVGVNCRAGISRSTAAALILYVTVYGFADGSERFWNAVGMAAPNETLIRIADAKLGLGDSMLVFCENMVDRMRSERGLIVPKGLLRMANKTTEDFVFQSEIDDLAEEYGVDIPR